MHQWVLANRREIFFLDKDAEEQRRHMFDSRRRKNKTEGKVLRSAEF